MIDQVPKIDSILPFHVFHWSDNSAVPSLHQEEREHGAEYISLFST